MTRMPPAAKRNARRGQARAPRTAGPRLAVGMTTFNRQQMVEMAARSLAATRGIENCAVVVVDDASQDYDLGFLKALFPPHAVVTRNAANSGRADFAAIGLYERLYETGADLLLSLDSDLILSSDALYVATEAIAQTDGVLALFNTPAHPALPGPVPGGGLTAGGLVEKKTVGNAGVIWRRELLREIIDKVPPSTQWDWDFCRYLTDTGRRIFALRRSAVQHVGFVGGQNSSLRSGDFGVGFADWTPAHTGALLEALVLGLQAGLGDIEGRLGALEQAAAKPAEPAAPVPAPEKPRAKPASRRKAKAKP